jgi:cell division septum initiation protein DivIVA
MGAEGITGEDALLALLSNRSLPTAVRGYDRAATDRLFDQLEQAVKERVRQHADALSRVGELERRIADGQEREEAVTEALVVATQIRAESEREGREITAKHARDGEAIEAEAKQRAEGIVRDAEVESERIVEDARQTARGFEHEIRDAEQMAVDARARVTGFLESLLAEVEQRGGDRGSAVDDLFMRAGDTAWNEDGSLQAPFDGP